MIRKRILRKIKSVFVKKKVKKFSKVITKHKKVKPRRNYKGFLSGAVTGVIGTRLFTSNQPKKEKKKRYY